MPYKEQPQSKEAPTRMKASNVVKEFEKEIKELRKERDSLEGNSDLESKRRSSEIHSKLDSRYRDQHDLKKLGDKEIRVERGKDGQIEIGDRREVKRQVRELDEKQRTKGRGLGRGR